MRRSSRTNSNPQRSEIIHNGYTAGRYYDELLKYFPTNGCGMARVPGYEDSFSMLGTDATECHHCWGRVLGNGRWDRPWNLAMVCKPVHDFCHKYRTDVIVICLRFKIDQGFWDFDNAKQCLGFDPYGWVEMRKCKFPWAERHRLNILDQVGEQH